MTERTKLGRIKASYLRTHTEEEAAERWPELEEPDLPEWTAQYLMNFYALHQRRSWTESGPSPISFTDIQAYSVLTHVDMSPYEVHVVCALDAAYLRAYSAIQATRTTSS